MPWPRCADSLFLTGAFRSLDEDFLPLQLACPNPPDLIGTRRNPLRPSPKCSALSAESARDDRFLT